MDNPAAARSQMGISLAFHIIFAVIGVALTLMMTIVEQLANLLRQDLPVSRRIEIRETTRTAFEAGDDVVSKIRPFLKGTEQRKAEQQQNPASWTYLLRRPEESKMDLSYN